MLYLAKKITVEQNNYDFFCDKMDSSGQLALLGDLAAVTKTEMSVFGTNQFIV